MLPVSICHDFFFLLLMFPTIRYPLFSLYFKYSHNPVATVLRAGFHSWKFVLLPLRLGPCVTDRDSCCSVVRSISFSRQAALQANAAHTKALGAPPAAVKPIWHRRVLREGYGVARLCSKVSLFILLAPQVGVPRRVSQRRFCLGDSSLTLLVICV